MTSQYLFTLTASPSLEDALVDWLLKHEAQGFSSHCVNGHSGRLEGLTLAEQVSGRKRQVRFEMHIPADKLNYLLEQLKQEFGGANLHYWITPLVESGHI